MHLPPLHSFRTAETEEPQTPATLRGESLHVSKIALYDPALKDVKYNLIVWICKLLLSNRFNYKLQYLNQRIKFTILKIT